MIANPILTRELRARWRSGLSNVLLFCYAFFLALAAWLVYASASFSARDGGLLRQMADAGHTLFLTLSAMQIGAWMLLGPALTATTIAGERERGLLEMLQMTPMTAWHICAGKLMAVFGFVALLMFAPLPMTALCFLLGGVSPGEFLVAFALQISTAIFGLSIGLWASAWSRRATTALALAFGGIVVWNILTFLILMAHAMGSPWASLTASGNAWQSFFLDGAWRTNSLLVFLIDNLDVSATRGSWFSNYTQLDFSDWLLCIAFQLLCACVLIGSATRALWKPLQDDDTPITKTQSSTRYRKSRFFERKTTRQIAAIIPSQSAVYASPTANSPIANSPIANSPTANSPTANSKREWELPFLSRFQAANPVLEREVRRWGRVRRLGRVVARWTRMTVLLIGGVYFLGFCILLYNPVDRAIEMFWLLIAVGTILGLLVACGVGAVLFTREHEAGTWHGLQLSLLTPRQILAGKIVPALAVCTTFCVAFWLPALVCLDGVLVEASSRAPYLQVPFFQWIYSLIIAVSASVFCLCWSAMLSAFFKRIWLAVAWAMGTLLLLYVGLPIFVALTINLFFRYSSSSEFAMMAFLRSWHPLFALVQLNEGSSYQRTTPLGIALVFVVMAATVSAFLLFTTERLLRKATAPSR